MIRRSTDRTSSRRAGALLIAVLLTLATSAACTGSSDDDPANSGQNFGAAASAGGSAEATATSGIAASGSPGTDGSPGTNGGSGTSGAGTNGGSGASGAPGTLPIPSGPPAGGGGGQTPTTSPSPFDSMGGLGDLGIALGRNTYGTGCTWYVAGPKLWLSITINVTWTGSGTFPASTLRVTADRMSTTSSVTVTSPGQVAVAVGGVTAAGNPALGAPEHLVATIDATHIVAEAIETNNVLRTDAAVPKTGYTSAPQPIVCR